MLKDKIEKKTVKKRIKDLLNRVNLLNSRFRSWTWNNLIKSKLKKNMKVQSSLNLTSKVGIEIEKKKKKKYYSE
jgi:hypothetical protein